MNGAKTLYEPKGIANPPIGTVEAGKLADLIVAPENPLANFKSLYATGHVRLNTQTDEVERVGRVQWTIKDGIVYDADRLRADVRAMVDEQQAAGADGAGGEARRRSGPRTRTRRELTGCRAGEAGAAARSGSLAG